MGGGAIYFRSYLYVLHNPTNALRTNAYIRPETESSSLVFPTAGSPKSLTLILLMGAVVGISCSM